LRKRRLALEKMSNTNYPLGKLFYWIATIVMLISFIGIFSMYVSTDVNCTGYPANTCERVYPYDLILELTLGAFFLVM
jgi:hypothetical protein